MVLPALPIASSPFLPLSSRLQRIAVLSVGLLVLAISLALFALSVHRPYIGADVVLRRGVYEIGQVDRNGLAYEAGIQTGDKVVAADGQRLDLGDQSPSFRGHAVSSLVVTNRDNNLIEVQVEGSEAAWSSAVAPLSFLGIGLLFWTIGLFAFLKRPDSKPARLLFLVSCSILLALIGASASTRNVPTAVTLQVVDWLLVPPLFLNLFLEFPQRKKYSSLRRVVGWGAYLWAATALVAYFAVGYRDEIYSPYFRGFLLLNLSAGLLAGIGALVHTWLTSSEPRIRQQTKIVVAGTVVGTFPFLALSTLPEVLFGRTIVAPEITILAVLLMPLSITYAIVKHKLMDIDLVIRRGLVYASMTAMMAVVFFLLLAAVGFGQSLVSVERITVTLALSAGAAVLFGPAKESLGNVFDRLFYKDRYDYNLRIKEISNDIASLKGVGDISEFVVSAMAESIQPTGVCVCVKQGTGRYEVAAASGVFSATSRQQDLARLLPMLGPDSKFPNAAPSPSTEVAFFVPLVANDQEVGVLCLGCKSSGKRFSMDDTYLLYGVAPVVAAALNNAMLLTEIGSRDAELRVAYDGLRESEGQYRALVEAGDQMGVAIVLLQNVDGIEAAHVFANGEWARMTGYSVEALKTRSYLDLVHPLYKDGVAARLRQGLQGKETPGRYEVYVVARDGTETPVEATGSPVTYMGRPAVVGYMRNITDRKQAEARLREMATRDYLTGLWNHREFQARLPAEIARAKRSGEHFSLLFLDIDHFKLVNDRFGHQMGDRILQAMGRFLKDALRASDIACRYGGDEFAVILPNTDVNHSGALVSRILEASDDLRNREPLLRGLSPQLGVSIGVAAYPEDSTEAQELVRKANQAMFYAKSLGGNRSQVWGDAMKEFEAEPDKLRGLLRQANLDTALALAGAIDARDAHTLGHSKRVSELSSAVARKLGLQEADTEGVRISGLLHDVGKIGLPDALLHKRDALTDEQFRTVKRHVDFGVKMLSGIDYMKDKLGIIQGHHENWDGSGYPQGISGDSIALGARIIRVVDTYDAMVTDRPYRRHMSQAEALKELENLAGKAFDPAVVSALVTVVKDR